MSTDDPERPDGEPAPTDTAATPEATEATAASGGDDEAVAEPEGAETAGEAPEPSEAPAEPRSAERRPAPKARKATSETPAERTDGPGEGERIAKVLSRAGVASRRDCERLILEGRVTRNGERVESPALNVLPSDRLAVDGVPVAEAEPVRLWIFHKPAGLVTTEKDEEGRATVFDSLPEDLPRVMSVGRLDLTSEGLLLLTNDGEVKRKLELPSTGWLRRYRVRINGALSEEQLDELRRGVTVDGFDYEPMEVEFDRQQGANAWLTVGLREGKNREIRRVMEHLGAQVSRLIRVSYGPFQLGNLEPGAVEEVRSKVVRDQLGLGAPTPRRVRRKGEGAALPPVAVATPERVALTPRLPAGAVKRSLKARAEGPKRSRKVAGPAPLPVPDKPGPSGARKARTYLRKEGPRPVTAELEEKAREIRRAEREAERAAGGPRRGPPRRDEGEERPRSARPAPRAGERPDRPARPRSEGFRSHKAEGGGDRPARAPRRNEGGPARPRSEGFRSHRDEGGDRRPARGPDERPARAPRTPREGAGDRPARPPRAGARPEGTGSDRPRRAAPARFDRPEGREDRPRAPRAPREDRGADRPPRDSRPPRDGDREGGARRGPPKGGPARSGGPRASGSGFGGGPQGAAGGGKDRPRSGPGGPRSGPPRSGGPRLGGAGGPKGPSRGGPSGAAGRKPRKG